MFPLGRSMGPLGRSVAGSGAPFLPTDIAGLRLWLKADSLVLSDGDPVSTWADSSGSGHDATQGTAINRPTFKAAFVNGLPAVRFQLSPINNFYHYELQLPDFLTGLAAATVFCVLRKDVANDGGHWHHWGSDGNGNHYAYGDNTIYDGLGTTSRQTAGSPIVDVTAWHLFNVTVGGGTWTLRLNGPTQYTTGGVTVGWNANPKVGFNNYSDFIGYISEILAYNSALSPSDRASVETYLNSRYSIY